MNINNFGSIIGKQAINSSHGIKWTISTEKKDVIHVHYSGSEREAKELAERVLRKCGEDCFATVFMHPIKCVKKFGGDWVDEL